MRLLIDLDGVCADFYGFLLKVYNKDFRDDLKFEDLYTWALEPCFKKATRSQIRSYMSVPGFWHQLRPLPGAVEGLKRLQDAGHDVVIVSATPRDATLAGKEKLEWVHEHLPFIPHKNIILAARKELIMGDVLFDDGPHNAKARPDSTCVMDAPYNQGVEGKWRVRTWTEFEKLVEGLQ